MFLVSEQLLQPSDLLLLQISDEEDDKISASIERYISSWGALTLVRPIRQAGRK
jgi:hypothetical protein